MFDKHPDLARLVEDKKLSITFEHYEGEKLEFWLDNIRQSDCLNYLLDIRNEMLQAVLSIEGWAQVLGSDPQTATVELSTVSGIDPETEIINLSTISQSQTKITVKDVTEILARRVAALRDIHQFMGLYVLYHQQDQSSS